MAQIILPSVAIVTVSSGATLTGTNTAGTILVNNTLTGGGSLAMNGSGGTLALEVANNFSGATSVLAGLLRLDNASALASTTGVTISGGELDLNGVSITSSLPITLSGGNLSVTGNVAISNAITLGSATSSTLTSNTSNNTFTLNGNINGAGSLGFAGPGNFTLHDEIGTGTPLTTVGSTTKLNLTGTTIQTTGAQNYTAPITLGADSEFASSGNYIWFQNGATINGAYNLVVNAGYYIETDAVIGGATPVASITMTAPTMYAGANFNSTGAQVYNGTVPTYANNTFTASSGSITFNGPLQGYGSNPSAITLSGAGGNILNGNVGTLDSLTLTGGGTDQINTSSIVTTGNQTYNDTTRVGATTTLQTNSGNIIIGTPGFTWAPSSSYTLNLNSAGTITINGPINGSGATSTLNLTAVSAGTNAAGITTGSAGVIVVSNFNLLQGGWSQVGTLPAFSATNFMLNSGNGPTATVSFVRALSGNGSGGSPYLLADVYGLEGVGANPTSLTQQYKLNNNIDASGTSNWNSGAGFVPIGYGGIWFSGVMNGQNFAVNNLYINRPSTGNIGLFGALVTTASVSNIGVTNANITGNNQVGILAGYIFNLSNPVSNTYTSGSVTGVVSNTESTGGLIGRDDGSVITNSHSSATVTSGSGGYMIGGFVGFNANNASITNSYSTGNVIGVGTVAGIGGFVGGNYNGGSISNSFTSSNVSTGASASSVGGFVGQNEFTGGSAPTISSSYSTGSVSTGTGANYVGGFTGYDVSGVTSNAYSTSSVTTAGSSNAIGGFAGLVSSSTITNVYSNGTVSSPSSTNVGGLIGSSTSTTPTSSYWDMTTSTQPTSNGGVGETTSQMYAQATYSGWNFSTTWGIVEGQTYPYLLSFYSSAPRAVSGTSSATAGTTVNLVIGGVITASTSTNSSGQFNFLLGNNLVSGVNNSIADNTPVLFYLGNGTTYSNDVAITPSSGGSLSNLSLAANTLTLGGANTATISNANLATAAGALSDPYILYSVSSNNLTLGNASHSNINLATTATTTYSANGNVTPYSGSSNITLAGPVSLGASTVTWNAGTTGTINVSGNITGNSDALVITNNDANSSISGTISGVTSLTKNGSGTLDISGTNSSWSGSTILSSGTLQGDNNSAFGTGSLTFNGGTFQSNGGVYQGGVYLTLGNNYTVAGAVTFGGSGNFQMNGTGTLSKWLIDHYQFSHFYPHRFKRYS